MEDDRERQEPYTPDRLWADATGALADEDYAAAGPLFKEFARRWPDDQRAAEAGYRALEARFGHGRARVHPGAAVAALVKRHPRSLWTARALVLASETYGGWDEGLRISRSWRRSCRRAAVAIWRGVHDDWPMTREEADELARMQLRAAGGHTGLEGLMTSHERAFVRSLLQEICDGPGGHEVRSEAASRLNSADAVASQWSDTRTERIAARQQLVDRCVRQIEAQLDDRHAYWAAHHLLQALEDAEFHGEPTEACRQALSLAGQPSLRTDDVRKWERFTWPTVTWHPAGVALPGEPTSLSLTARNTTRVELQLWRIALEAFWPAKMDHAWEWSKAERHATMTAEWACDVPAGGQYERQELRIELPALAAGLYHVLAWPAERPAAVQAHPLNVGSLSLVQQSANGRFVVHTIDRATGHAVPAVETSMVAVPGPSEPGPRRSSQGRTSATAGWSVSRSSLKAGVGGALYTAVRRGDEAAVARGYLWAGEAQDEVVGQVCADRAVYRPGETVRFRLVVGRRTAAGWVALAATPVTLTMHGPYRDNVYELDETVTDPAGMVTGVWSVPSTASLGAYHLKATLASGDVKIRGWRHFLVEEYQRSEVRLDCGIPGRKPGGWTVLPVAVKGLAGEPLAYAELTYVVGRHPWWWQPRAERPADWEQQKHPDCLTVARGRLTTDRLGQAEVRFRATSYTADYRYLEGVMPPDGWCYAVHIGHTDRRGYLTAAARDVYVSRQQVFLELDLERRIVAPNQPVTVIVRAETADQRPCHPPVTLELRRLVPAAESVDPRTGEPSSEGLQPGPVVWRALPMLDAAGAAAVDLVIPGGGPWELRASVLAQDGGPARATGRLWAATSDCIPPELRHRDLQLLPEEAAAVADRPLRVVVSSPVAGADLLLSVLAGRRCEQRLVRLPAPTSVITLDVPGSWAPGVTLAGLVMGPHAAYEAQVALPVAAARSQLQVAVVAEPGSAVPGEAGRLAVTTRDVDGRPVAARICLTAVDARTHQFGSPDAAPLVAAFNSPGECRGLFAHTGFSWTHYHDRRGDATVHSERLPLRRRGYWHVNRMAPTQPLDELAASCPGGRHLLALPEHHAEALVWRPDLRTGIDGRATVEATFPAQPATWRVMAQAMTDDGRCGEAVILLPPGEGLWAKLTAPTHLVQGDRLRFAAMVTNTTTVKQEGSLRLSVQGIELEGDAVVSIALPSGGQARIERILRAGRPGPGRLQCIAETDDHRHVVIHELQTVAIAGDRMPDGGLSGVGLERRYAVLRQRRLEYLVLDPPRLEPLKTSTSFQPGDVLEVTLVLTTTADLTDATLRDPVPSGYEPLGPRATTPWPPLGDSNKPAWRREVWPSEVRFSSARLPVGQTTLTYRMRVIFAGECHAVPATLTCGANAEIVARSGTELLSTTDPA